MATTRGPRSGRSEILQSELGKQAGRKKGGTALEDWAGVAALAAAVSTKGRQRNDVNEVKL